MSQLIKLGRLSHFDRILKEYPTDIEDLKQLTKLIIKMWQRVNKTYDIMNKLREIFRDYKKHKTAYQTLAELGIYMNKPGFN